MVDLLNTVEIKDKLYRVEGTVQLTSVVPFAGKITTGDYSRSSEPLRSTWSLENLSGGIGIDIMDPEKHADRYYWGSLDATYERQLVRPRKPILAIGGRPSGLIFTTGQTYKDKFYGAWSTKIMIADYSVDGWASPVEASYADLSNVATDSIVTKVGGNDYLIFADGLNYIRYDGTTWTKVTGDGVTIPKIMFFTEFDGAIWALDINNLMWQTTNLTSWTFKATLPVQAGDVHRFDVYFDQNDNPIIMASTNEGLWQYNQTANKWYRTRLKYPRHKYGGFGMTNWRDTLYQSAGLDAYAYTGNTVAPMGPSRDYGIPSDYNGYIVTLVNAFNWLVAGIDKITTASGPTVRSGSGALSLRAVNTLGGKSSLLRWTGSGWHPLWLGTGTAGIHWANVVTANSQQRLYWSVGNDIYWMKLPDGIWNPKAQPDGQFDDIGFLWTGRYNAGWWEQNKLWFDVEARLLGGDASNFLDIYYALDGSVSWTYLGRIDTSVSTRLVFNGGAGLASKDIRLWLDVHGSSPTSVYPVVDYVIVSFMRRQRDQQAFSFTIIAMDESPDGRSPGQQIRDLRDDLTADEAVPFSFRTPANDLVNRYVVRSQHGDALFTGVDDRGRIRLSLVEA